MDRLSIKPALFRSPAAFLGLAAILTLGCSDSIGPTTGAIEIRVSTAGAMIDFDPDGYTLSIDGGPGQAVSVSTVLTIANLPPGSHLVRLDGLAGNCSVSGINPLSVVVIAGALTPPVSFSVSCVAKTASIQVSTATSGLQPDPDGYSVIVTEANGGAVLANGTITINGTVTMSGIRLVGPAWVTLSGVSGNCVVDGTNPRPVFVTFGAPIEVAFVIRC